MSLPLQFCPFNISSARFASESHRTFILSIAYLSRLLENHKNLSDEATAWRRAMEPVVVYETT